MVLKTVADFGKMAVDGSASVPFGYVIVKADDIESVRDQTFIQTWPSYISHLLHSGDVTDAAIFDLNGKHLATSRPDFDLDAEEFAEILIALTDPQSFKERGFKVSGSHYNLVCSDRKFGLIGRSGLPAVGCTVCKTNKLLIIGAHDATIKSRNCNAVVMSLGDFLRQKDW